MFDIPARLGAILKGLRQAIAAFADRESRAQITTWIGAQAFRPRQDPSPHAKLPIETWILLWHRLARTANRVQALFTRWQNNTLPLSRPARPSASRATPQQPIARLPRARGWINARIPESAPSAGMLDMLLQEPELPAFLAAAPQAGRLLRPLVRALGLQSPDWLKLPEKPKPARRVPAPAARAPEPRGTPDRPLPPYIRAAVRAWKRHGT